MEKKWLMVSVVALVAGLCIGAILGLVWGSIERAEIKRENEILRGAWEALDADHEALLIQYDFLNETYENTLDIMQGMFTYYVEGQAISISNVTIIKLEYWETYNDINGTLTNISDKPIEILYLYLIIRNPDGTADLPDYGVDYELMKSLYIDESTTFEFTMVSMDEGQTVEFLLIY